MRFLEKTLKAGNEKKPKTEQMNHPAPVDTPDTVQEPDVEEVKQTTKKEGYC